MPLARRARLSTPHKKMFVLPGKLSQTSIWLDVNDETVTHLARSTAPSCRRRRGKALEPRFRSGCSGAGTRSTRTWPRSTLPPCSCRLDTRWCHGRGWGCSRRGIRCCCTRPAKSAAAVEETWVKSANKGYRTESLDRVGTMQQVMNASHTTQQ